MAANGRGTCDLVTDNTNLRPIVIKALANSGQPSLKDVEFTFGEKLINKRDVFRNQLIHHTKLVDDNEFSKLYASFSCAQDPVINRAINWNIDSSQFVKIEDETYAEALFKKAAKDIIEKNMLTQSLLTDMSVKYQVLSDYTSYIGVIKQKNKETGEL